MNPFSDLSNSHSAWLVPYMAMLEKEVYFVHYPYTGTTTTWHRHECVSGAFDGGYGRSMETRDPSLGRILTGVLHAACNYLCHYQ
jgi:hypothetical protein